MVPLSISKSAIILFTALILVQGATALTLEQAPLNPAFVAYTEGLDAHDGIAQCSANRSVSRSTSLADDARPAYGTDAPYTLGLIPAPGVIVWPDQYTVTAQINGASLPTRFDLRDEGRVTSVRDQGNCGSCWAFAAYGSLESTYLTDTGEAENFSENNMNNLCSNLYEDGFDYDHCDGGDAPMATAYLTRGSGPIRETDDPYILPLPSTISPTDLSPVLDVRDVTYLPPRTGSLDNDLFKQTLMNDGAIYAGFQVNLSCFAENYTTYYWPGDEYISDGGHAVALVGWDDDFPKESFAITPPGNGAFILKNSWGTDIGEGGYFFISYYDPILCYFWVDMPNPYDFTFYNTPGALYTGVLACEGRQIYQYDPLGWTQSIGTGASTTCYGANVFTANGYEALTDVSFYTREPETEYTIAIFTNFITPPGDAEPVAWTSGTCALPGYHTVSLPNSVPLMSGDTFSVVIEISSPNDVHPLVVEKPIIYYSSNATANAGESYVSEDGETWDDLTIAFPNTNVCIKAFTHPFTVVPDNYSTIQAAIDAAASGDTIIVKAGTYPEELVLNKKVTLVGVGMPVVAIPAEGDGVVIVADNITITGFTFDGNGAASTGMDIVGNNCTIRDVEITGCELGLFISGVSGLMLSQTALHDNEYNIICAHYVQNPGNDIDETVTVNGRPVIYRESMSGEIIDASSNAGAIICVNCTDIIIRDTTTGMIGNGIDLHYCRDVIVENITADKVIRGIQVTASQDIMVRNSSFGPDMQLGMEILETNRFLAEGNGIACIDLQGILLILAENATIKNNIIDGQNDIGIFGIMLSNCSVNSNTINRDTGLGIGIRLAENVEVSHNTINTSVAGIVMQIAENIQVSDNTIHCNETGTALAIIADGADITHNYADNCSIQAFMDLSNSVVRDNHLSGTDYPEIGVAESGGDVYVYRNDFVLTEPDDMDRTVFIAGVTRTEDSLPDMQAMAERYFDSSRSAQLFLTEQGSDSLFQSTVSGYGLSTATASSTERHAEIMDVDWDSAVWNSPTPETYWYNGNAFTAYMGNYWSTYNGTDTTHDGIGDTPFTIYGNETDICPLMKPFAWYLTQNPNVSDGSDPSADMATSPALTTGQSAILHFTGSAVQQVMITAADGTGSFLLTVNPSPSGPDGLTGQVYQYITAELTGMSDDQISGAEFAFRVPAAWLRAEGIAPANIALWRFHDGVWQELPTSIIREEGGWVSFTATTPGFSSFAIAEGTGKYSVTETPAVENKTETADVTITITPEPPVTVFVPEEEKSTPTESATPPQKSPIGFITIIGGATGAVLIFRKRYQNE